MAITTAGKTKILDNLNSNLEYIALQKATGEFFRKAIATSEIDGDTLIVDISLDESEANDTITDVDCYGWGATATLESGTQFSTNPTSFTKTSADVVTISAEIQVQEV